MYCAVAAEPAAWLLKHPRMKYCRFVAFVVVFV